jgi:hypothetical protein
VFSAFAELPQTHAARTHGNCIVQLSASRPSLQRRLASVPNVRITNCARSSFRTAASPLPNLLAPFESQRLTAFGIKSRTGERPSLGAKLPFLRRAKALDFSSFKISGAPEEIRLLTPGLFACRWLYSTAAAKPELASHWVWAKAVALSRYHHCSVRRLSRLRFGREKLRQRTADFQLNLSPTLRRNDLDPRDQRADDPRPSWRSRSSDCNASWSSDTCRR